MTTATIPEGVASAASDARGITIVRVFDAPRELVFSMWTQAEHFVTWFGEHGSEIPLDKCEMDARPGGAWNATMYHGPERIEIPFQGWFRTVDPPSHIEMTLTDPDLHPDRRQPPGRRVLPGDARDADLPRAAGGPPRGRPGGLSRSRRRIPTNPEEGAPIA